MFTARFNHATECNEMVGGKALNLIKMSKLGMPVPDGFVITSEAFSHFLEKNQLDIKSESIQTEVMEAVIPDDLVRDVLTAFWELRKRYPAVAVRSSSGAEDLEGASFAGQYETYLNVKTEEDFLGKVKSCWASCFENRVQQYTENIFEGSDSISMGIVVQGQIYSDISGVIFSQDPVTYNPECILINASYGLGEAVVSGLVTPDTYLVSRDGTKMERAKGSKEMKIISDSSGTMEVATNRTERNAYCLSDKLIHTLIEMTLKVENYYNHPVDLEFGIHDQQVYLLQARPITTEVKKKESVPEARKGYLLERKDEDEFWFLLDTFFPNPISPLFTSIVTQPFYEGMAMAVDALKEPTGYTNMKAHNGYYYGKQTFFETDPNQLLAEQEKLMEEMYPRMRDRMYEIIYDKLIPIYRYLDGERAQAFTVDKVKKGLVELEAFYKDVYFWHFMIVFPSNHLNRKLESIYQKATGDAPLHELYQSLAGVMNKSLESDRLLWELSLKVKAEPSLMKVFMESEEGSLLQNLNTIGRGKDFLNRVESFVSVYGYRSTKSHDFIEDTWIENHEHVLQIIKNFVLNDHDFDKEFESAVTARKQMYQKIINGIKDPNDLEAFEEQYKLALDAAVITDDHHFYIDAMFDAKARLYLLKVSELLVQQQVLDDKEDIWFVYKDEILAALDEPHSLMEVVKERKKQYEIQGKIKAPSYFGKPSEKERNFVEMVFGSLEEDKENTGNVMKGIAASGGISEGPVRVISSMQEASKFQKGDILVCKNTTPVWTTFFQDAEAIVTDTGGMLSHSAIIAREYQIPAVLGTKVGTERLHDGDWVIVDGNTGTVTMIG
ncbi:MAG: PEP/pyruvate-binding domain-containing protein [Peribacillus sp.]